MNIEIRFYSILSMLLACGLTLSNSGISFAEPQLSAETPRHAFYRGEEILYTIKCVNSDDQVVENAILKIELAGCIRDSTKLELIPAGGELSHSFRLPTQAIKAGQYNLVCSLSYGNTEPIKLTEPIVIGARPLPDQMLIWLWGGSGCKFLRCSCRSFQGWPRARKRGSVSDLFRYVRPGCRGCRGDRQDNH